MATSMKGHKLSVEERKAEKRITLNSQIYARRILNLKSCISVASWQSMLLLNFIKGEAHVHSVDIFRHLANNFWLVTPPESV